MDDKQKAKQRIKVGAPLQHFEAVVELLVTLRQDGRVQIFLTRDNLVRVIGHPDDLRVGLSKKLDIDTIDRVAAERMIAEVRRFIQVRISSENVDQALHIFEHHVFEEEFEQANKDSEAAESLRDILKAKIGLVEKLISSSLLERTKRLSTATGAVLDDVDIEIVGQRKSQPEGEEILTPFLRLRIRYTHNREPWPFTAPPWILNQMRSSDNLDLECDESDIDVLIRRLVEAKEMLARSMKEKLEQP